MLPFLPGPAPFVKVYDDGATCEVVDCETVRGAAAGGGGGADGAFGALLGGGGGANGALGAELGGGGGGVGALNGVLRLEDGGSGGGGGGVGAGDDRPNAFRAACCAIEGWPSF